MSIIAIGVNHKTAPVEIRERMAFTEGSLQDSYASLHTDPALLGAVIISTCNRTEVYAHVADPNLGVRAIRQLLSRKSGVEPALINKYTYVLTQDKTVHHLFRVAAGLDSMLLGETQILGQIKDAFQWAKKFEATDKVINTLFKQALTVGKRVRTETGIDRHAVSISYAAVELAKKFFGDITGRSVLVIGAGKMSGLTAKHLVANGVSGVIVSNRSYQKAQVLADQFNGQAVKFDSLYENMVSADIVISCTAASHYVVRKHNVQEVLAANQGKKIMMVDIAVPRDIEPGVGELPGISLYDIDALQNVVDENIKERETAAVLAEAIILEHVEEFARWQGSLFVVPTVSALKRRGEEIKQKELMRAFNRLGDVSEHERKVIGSLANAIVNQLLHTPVTQLKDYALTDKGQIYTEALNKLFCLDEPTDEAQEKGMSRPIDFWGNAQGQR